MIELVVRPTTTPPAGTQAHLLVDKQEFTGYPGPDGAWHFLFSPKESKSFRYRVVSNHSGLDGQEGAFTSRDAAPEQASKPSSRYPNWWTDDPAPQFAEGPHQGARTINSARAEILRDFASRLRRAGAPQT